jgi:hypothetical protein
MAREKVKLTVNVLGSELEELQREANSEGTNVTTELRRAIALKKLAFDAKQNSHKLLIEEAPGVFRQIELI